MSAAVQHAFLSITPIRWEHEGPLRDLLEKIDGRDDDDVDVEDNPWMPFPKLRTIHFARFGILPADDSLGLSAQLMFASNFDGPLDAHLTELDEKAKKGLDEIYQHCEDYPEAPTSARRIRYLRTHSVRYNAWYGGTVGRTVDQIHQEEDLRQAIEDFLGDGNWTDEPATMVRKAVQDFVGSESTLSWARTPAEPWLRPGTRLIKWLATYLGKFVATPWLSIPALVVLLVVMFTVAPVLLAVLLGVLLLFVIVLRFKEMHDDVDIPTHLCPDVGGLMAHEDRILQNQMTIVNHVKAGPFRRFTLRAVLAAINLAARFLATDGNLGGIPSIHFARWAVLDKGRRLLFLSNFDGSWENYLGDFIDKAATGLTAVWSNTVGFPKTKWLGGEGARDEQRFKDYARKDQLPTQVWYTAYKELSVQNVNNNSRIRDGLYGSMSEPEAREWLQRF